MLRDALRAMRAADDMLMLIFSFCYCFLSFASRHADEFFI